MTDEKKNNINAFGSDSNPQHTASLDFLERFELETDRRYGYRFVKRAFDIIFSLLVAAMLIIPSLIVALVISLDSHGSPLYKQIRTGRYGKPMTIIKFRTMVSDSDNIYKYLSPEQIALWNSERKVPDDPRITQIGYFLRRTSMDELPQFVNVLKGEMSVIGPRPITAEELQYFGKDAVKLLKTKPGITGWWQVEARNEAIFEDGTRQELEMYYVENQKFSLDLRIFFRTFKVIVSKTGR